MWRDLWSWSVSGLSRKTLLAVAVSLPMAGAGCAHHHHHDDDVVVVHERVYSDVEPPVARVEIEPVRPSPDHVWVKGHYLWRAGRYEWAPGHFILAPRRDAIWEEGRWQREGGRYFWVEGRWR
jgi:hypothetical protein